jgi:hypothetical protein
LNIKYVLKNLNCNYFFEIVGNFEKFYLFGEAGLSALTLTGDEGIHLGVIDYCIPGVSSKVTLGVATADLMFLIGEDLLRSKRILDRSLSLQDSTNLCSGVNRVLILPSERLTPTTSK